MAETSVTYEQTWAQTIFAHILKQGPMPKHVAFIMDGNRRYAKRMNFSSVIEGHRKGSEILDHVLELGRYFGIPEISVYAFSSENFKRSKEEVEGLMALFKERALRFKKEIHKYMEYDVRFDVVGDYKLACTQELRNIFAQVISSTKNNKTYKINLCLVYTGRAQITKGLTTLLNGLKTNELKTSDISEALLGRVMSMANYRPVDILIRTSGETRLSDFMMWEASNAYIHIIDMEWPAFSFWDFLNSILKYQVQLIYFGLRPSLDLSSPDKSDESIERQNKFVESVRTKVIDDIEKDL